VWGRHVRCDGGAAASPKKVGLDDNGQKNAPSFATWGKSTFSEGGGDNQCMQKSTLARNCTGVFVAMQQVRGYPLQKLVKLITSKTTQNPGVQRG
jgi:hypothetical protein